VFCAWKLELGPDAGEELGHVVNDNVGIGMPRQVIAARQFDVFRARYALGHVARTAHVARGIADRNGRSVLVFGSSGARAGRRPRRSGGRCAPHQRGSPPSANPGTTIGVSGGMHGFHWDVLALKSSIWRVSGLCAGVFSTAPTP
jgi:hypothetical protein